MHDKVPTRCQALRHTYDAFGSRSSATVAGSTTSFLYDGPNIIQELTGPSVKATILGGFGIDEIFRRTDASGPRNFLADDLGSTLALTDDAGVARTQYRYDPDKVPGVSQRDPRASFQVNKVPGSSSFRTSSTVPSGRISVSHSFSRTPMRCQA